MASLVDEVASGDVRRSLVAMRDRLAAEMEPTEHISGCECECGPPPASGRDLATLAKQVADLIERIDAMPRLEGSDPLDAIADGVEDELARRREDRIAGAKAS